MNDFDYENMQKKRLARNAKYKKGGSRSKKCTLPGDYLTKAQKAKLSKTIVSISMKAPITKADFLASSTFLKREYLEMCRDQFNAGSTNISEDLFGMHKSWLHFYIHRNEPGLADIFAKKRRMSAEQKERWLAFCRKAPVEEETAPSEPETEPEIAETEPAFGGIGERIRARREALGMTQETLAGLAGYKERTAIAKIENGDNGVSLNTLTALAAALKVRPEWLAGWEEEETETPAPTYTSDVHSAAVRSGSFTVTGRADEALELLRKLFAGDHHVGEFTLTFNYTKEENE